MGGPVPRHDEDGAPATDSPDNPSSSKQTGFPKWVPLLTRTGARQLPMAFCRSDADGRSRRKTLLVGNAKYLSAALCHDD